MLCIGKRRPKSRCQHCPDIKGQMGTQLRPWLPVGRDADNWWLLGTRQSRGCQHGQMTTKDQMNPLHVQMFCQSLPNSLGQKGEGEKPWMDLVYLELTCFQFYYKVEWGLKIEIRVSCGKYRFLHFFVPKFYGQIYYNHWKSKAELRHQKRPLIKTWPETFSTLEGKQRLRLKKGSRL